MSRSLSWQAVGKSAECGHVIPLCCEYSGDAALLHCKQRSLLEVALGGNALLAVNGGFKAVVEVGTTAEGVCDVSG